MPIDYTKHADESISAYNTRIANAWGSSSGVITPGSMTGTQPYVLEHPVYTNNGLTDNSSITNPFPTAEEIINSGNAPTAADTQQTDILNRIASLTGTNQTQTQLENTAENAAGIPGLANNLNALNTQLEGLNNQATALQNEAVYTIPNQMQLGAEGRGITAGGLAPLTASAQRMNQIKQGAIATQALTLKSAIYGAQGKYNIAKDAADKAALGQYEAQQQKIDYQRAQLEALMPTLNREEKARAAIVQAKLEERQTRIDNAREDKKTAMAMATVAIKNFPDDPAAQFAAQQALAESNKEQPDLQKIFQLIGKYQVNPQEIESALLDMQYKRAQIKEIQNKTPEADTVLSPNEAKDFGVPYGTTKRQVYGMVPGSSSPTQGYNGEFAATIALASQAGSTNAQRDQIKTNMQEFIANGDYQSAYTQVLSSASSKLTGANASNFQQQQQSYNALVPMREALTELKNAGYDTNKLTGGLNKLQTKIGLLLTDPKYAAIATRLDSAFQQYRQNMTGAAFGVKESAEYASVLPNSGNSFALNLAKIDGASQYLNGVIESTINSTVGQGGLEIKAYAEGATPQPGRGRILTPPGGGAPLDASSLTEEEYQQALHDGYKDAVQSFNSGSGSQKGIIGGYDITSYATDPTHEAKIAILFDRINFVKSVADIDKYIMSVAPNSPVKGSDVWAAAQATSTPPALIMALMQQDSSFGTAGKAVRTKNPGNVGNTDSGATKSFTSWAEGIMAVAKNLAWRKIG